MGMTKYKNYKEVLTEDGSTTLYSKLYDETCHSTTGAVDETHVHYISGCEIVHKSGEYDPLIILEVGFGAGIGFLETKNTLDKKFTFISFEIDLELINIFEDKMSIKFEVDKNIYSHKTEQYSLHILLGNARESIKEIQKIAKEDQRPICVHAIYQDAFSPKRNAILWTTQWFRQLKDISHKDCVLSTYSSSSSIRKSLTSAGWKVYEGVKFGPKRSSTRARLTGKTDQNILDKLGRSPAIEITDENYKDYVLGKKNEKNKIL
jgi:tRNA U34 5-methylaminomethyl-2-thiouridine-forming methyltransferase MnmC